MRVRIIVILILTIGGCSRNTDKQAETLKNNDSTFAPGKPSSQALKKVDEEIDTISVIEFLGYFNENERKTYNLSQDATLKDNLDGSYTFWKHKRLLINDSLKTLDIWGYPKSYRRQKSGVTRVTTISEGENSIQIRIFTLDKNYNTIDIDLLTSYGGDEGISSRTFGQFKNDSLYAFTELISGWETDSIEQVIHMCLVLKQDGQIDRVANCR